MAGPGQSRGKGKALESIAARSGRDPAAIIDSIQAAEKAQAKAEAAKQRAAKVEASKKKVAAAKVASKKKSVGIGKGLNNKHDNTDDDEDATKDPNEVNYPSQIYSSLSPQEQYRFQCYRRSGFASKPIEKFVAKMLVDEANRRFVARRGTMVGLGGRRSQVNSGSSSANNGHGINGEDEAAAATVTDGSDLEHHYVHSNNKKRKKPSKRQMLQEESKRRRVAMDQPPAYLLNSFNNGTGSSNGSAGSSGLNSSSTAARGGVVVPPLDQLVVPNSASEIVAVVSTLAKCYAQRLVSAARRVADVEQEQNEVSTKTGATSATAQKPISPQHLLEARRYRNRAGLDPGFWMADRVVDGRRRNKASSSLQHASVGTSEAAALGTEDRTRSCFLAAIAAQDAYDAARTKGCQNDVDK